MCNKVEFTCRRCGDCCRKHGLYPVTSSDMVEMSACLGIEVAEFLSSYCVVAVNDGRRGLFLKGDNGACPFLADNGCSIHQFKPYVCSIFPDNDGYVTAGRLKADMRDATLKGSGLSQCAAWDLNDSCELAPNIEATIRFRIREDTDRHYFIRHTAIDADTIGYLARLAEARCRELPLYLLIGQKYGLLRKMYTGELADASQLIQVERDILYRYAGTCAWASMLPEAVITPKGVRASHVNGNPGIMLMVDELPEAILDAHFFYRRLGEAGIFSVMIEGHGIAYVTAFIIYTQCIDDILGNGTLNLMLSDGTNRATFECQEGIL